ncbi:hypothetical protein D3C73_1576950 [compost metagenome]
MTKGYVVFGQPHLQRSDQSASCILDQVRQTVIRHNIVPMPEYFLGFRLFVA